MKKKRKKKYAVLTTLPNTGSAPDVLKKENFAAASFGVRLFGSNSPRLLLKSFEIEVTNNIIVKWDTVIHDRQMFIYIPTNLSPVGSKESFISILEMAEEDFDCDHVICCIEKAGKDKSTILRTFMYIGFQPIPPTNPLLPQVGTSEFLFLGYEL